MVLNNILTALKEKLISSGNPDNRIHVEKIELLNKSLGTGTEIIGEIGLYLQALKTNDLNAYQLIEKEIDAYLKYCREKLGMF